MLEFLAVCLILGMIIVIPTFRRLVGALLALTAVGFLAVAAVVTVLVVLVMLLAP